MKSLPSSALTPWGTPTWRQMWRSPVLALGFGFGSGLIKTAPGTWGTLLGLLLFLPLLDYSPIAAWGVAVVGAFVGNWVCERSAELVGVHDHGGIVWDEMVAIWWVLLLLPQQSLLYWGMAFLLFRLFDILKPFPIRWADQRVHGGWGIMLDDYLAACYTISIIWGSYAVFFYKIG